MGRTLVFLLIAVAAAAAPDEAALEEARGAILEGRAHFEAGRHREGIAAYERAYRAFPETPHLFVIAKAWQRVPGACGETLAAWDRYVAHCGDCERLEAARSQRADFQQQCSVRLTINAPPGAVVSLDGAEIGPAPASVAVLEGDHVVRAVEGTQVAEQAVQLIRGKDRTLVLRFETPAATPVAVPASEPVVRETVVIPTPTDNTTAWVVFGLGAAGIAAGGVAWLVRNQAVTDFRDARSEDDAIAARDTAESTHFIGLVALGLGVVGATTGLLLVDWGDDATAALHLGPSTLGLRGCF